MSNRQGGAYLHASQAIANLRGVFVLILVSFHACLAYLASTPGPSASFDQPPFLWLAFPIVDEQRFLGFDIYCAWEDVHVMALMFFLSGLFVAPSLRRKGAGRFAADRLMRLGTPFLFNVLVLMPIAIYPIYHRLHPDDGLAAYLAAYRALPFLPNGPTWFLWLLTACCLLAAAVYALWPQALDALAEAASEARLRPQRLLAVLTLAATLAYLPLALVYGPFDWFERGPFSFQISRPLLYAVYYFAGVAVGAYGLGDGLLAPDGALSRHWRRLAVLSPLMLCCWMGLTGVTLTWPDFDLLPMRAISALAYVGASVAGVMLLIALSGRFFARPIGWLAPLSRHALGIFIVHYAPTVWMQYALSATALPAPLKAAIVFAVVLPASLLAAAALKRNTLGARLLGEAEAGLARAAPPLHHAE
jgi:hypothetical protein